MSNREAIRLLLVAVGVLCCLVGFMPVLGLLCSEAVPGRVRVASKLYHGEETNYAYVLVGSVDGKGGAIVNPEPGDWPSPPKDGDSVTVLFGGGGEKGAMLKSSRAFWRVWGWAVEVGSVGIALVVTGLFVFRYQPPPYIIKSAQTA